MGGPVSEGTCVPTSSGPVLEVVILEAEDLKNVNMVGKMSVYVVAWVEPHLKRSTSVRHKTGRIAVWKDALLFLPLTDAILLHPHSALTMQVYSTGTVSPTVVGTTYLALRDIAQMKATKANSKECDIVKLPLHRRSGRTQGSIRISVNLIGATIQQMMYALDKAHDGWSIEMPQTFSDIPDGVAIKGYPAVQAYKTAASLCPPPSNGNVNAAFWPSAPPLALAAPPLALAAPPLTLSAPPLALAAPPLTLAAPPTPSLTMNTSTPENRTTTPPPTRPPPVVPSSPPSSFNYSNVDPHPCAQARNQYIPVQLRRKQEDKGNFVFTFVSCIGGLVGGLVLGDMITAAL